MEFFKYKCPVCDQQFKSSDDIVVCPECGTPHHRECYENTGHCVYQNKHSENYSFGESGDKTGESSDDTITCPKCNHINEDTTFYCEKCGYPLNEQDRNNQQTNYTDTQNTTFGQNTPPFGFGGPAIQFDPLAGMKSDEEIAENIKVGEMAKFVGKTTQYYLLVFNRIKKLGNSKFNFSAFLFSGIYFLYRKMNTVGIIVSLLFLALTVGQTYIQLMPEYESIFTTAVELQYSMQADYTFSFSSYMSSLSSYLSMNDIIFLFSPLFLYLIRGIMMFICGFTANRAYYKHCTKKINKIKKSTDNTNLNKELESNGGVNLPLAACFVGAYLIITYIPLFI